MTQKRLKSKIESLNWNVGGQKRNWFGLGVGRGEGRGNTIYLYT